MVHTATRLFPGSPAAVSSYKGYIGIDRKSGDIAHYGKNFANGDRYGHWDIIINGVWPRGGTEHWVVSFKQPTQKGTRWLSANGGGGMGSETENRSDEKFVIMGSTKDCRVQRYDNFTAGPTNDGYLRAHRLGTDRDQADITAVRKPWQCWGTPPPFNTVWTCVAI